MRKLLSIATISFVGLFITSHGTLFAADDAANTIDPGSTAWMLTSCALVLLMTPGLALFYGGMVRTKNILGTMMQSMFCMSLVTVQWILIGYSLSFGTSQGGLLGGFDHLFLANVPWNQPFPETTIPHTLHMAFQLMFAIITPALISGAFAERVKFGPFVLFTLLWTTLVYDPIAHWVWGGGILSGDATHSWLVKWFGTGALDFAGGTVVHISSGFSALIFVILIGKRRGYPKQQILPNNLVLTVFGAGLLWFGWFGFNGGSGLSADGLAGLAFVVTHICAAAGALSWAIAEYFHIGKVSVLGVATGLVGGLVCITPASGYVEPMSALLMGLIAGLVCYYFVAFLKSKLGYDDSLDAFGVHGVGGTIGALCTGVFFNHAIADIPETVSIGSQFAAQAVATIITIVYATVVTVILVLGIDKTIGFRLTDDDELTGLDLSQHGEVGYNL